MAYIFIFGCFLLLGIATSLGAVTGYRGKVCDRSDGYDVPAEVKSDPGLRKRANDLVAFWSTGAAVLSVAPLVPVGTVIVSGGERTVGTWGFVVLALYGLAVVIVAVYPFERIKSLGRSVER
ncbi:hypothetical protein [Streptomyces lavendulocolor]|uniref:hypothetical protein n=1 Tax=Streptomyces lavendulocolor TaxID=67316 RepID=UPI003C2AC539